MLHRAASNTKYMRIVPAFGLGSPAAIVMGQCDRVYVDPLRWPFLDHGEREFILAHERAHCILGVEDEASADMHALEYIQSVGIDPINAYEAISKTLDLSRPDHRSRAEQVRQVANTMPSFYSPSNQVMPTQDSQDPGTGLDWQDIIEQGIDTGGDVLSSFLDTYYGGRNGTPTAANYPTPTQNSGPNTTMLLAGAAVVVVLLVLFLKK